MAAKPRAAWRIAGSTTSASGRRPCRASSSHQAARLPGTATALRPTALRRPSASSEPGGAAGSGSKLVGPTPPGQRPWPSSTSCVPSGRRRCAKPPPSGPTIIGSTTDSANSAAIAASTALPPAASISAPAAEASGWLVTTMPREARAGVFSVACAAAAPGRGAAWVTGPCLPGAVRAMIAAGAPPVTSVTRTHRRGVPDGRHPCRLPGRLPLHPRRVAVPARRGRRGRPSHRARAVRGGVTRHRDRPPVRELEYETDRRSVPLERAIAARGRPPPCAGRLTPRRTPRRARPATRPCAPRRRSSPRTSSPRAGTPPRPRAPGARRTAPRSSRSRSPRSRRDRPS